MSPERVCVGEEEVGDSMLMDETEKARGQNDGESGARNLEYQKRSGEYGRVCKVREGVLSRGGCIPQSQR